MKSLNLFIKKLFEILNIRNKYPFNGKKYNNEYINTINTKK